MGESTARIGVYADDKASPVVKSVQGSLQNLATQAKSSILTGVGLGAGVTAFNLLGRAVSSVTDLLGDAVGQAIADETSIRRLTASLKANVPAWDGDTAAIEKRILAGQKLGFTDDELRASLTVLVGATHDVSKAQELQNAAMDLARFKGIDLGTATDALVKIEGGRYRILASLGIKLREGATATEVLAAVTKVAAGQAAAFGDTTEGAMQGASIAIDELKEDLGRELLPVVKEVAIFARDTLVPALKDMIQVIKDAKPVWEFLGNAIGATGRIIGGVIDIGTTVPKMILGIKDSADDTTPSLLAMERGMGTAMKAMEAEVVTGTDAIVEEFEELPAEMADAMLKGQFELEDATAELVRFIAEGLTPAQEKAQAIAFLTSKAYADALASGKPAAIAKANELAAAALAVLANPNVAPVVSGAQRIAASFAAALASGLIANLYRIDYALSRYAGKLIGFSPPKEGPLKGIDKGAFNIGKAWTTNFAKGIGPLNLPALPGTASGTAGLALAGAGSGGGIRDVHVHIEGPVYADGPAIDMLANRIATRLRFAPGT